MNSSTNAEAFVFDTEFSSNGDVIGSSGGFRRYRQEEVDALCEQARQAALKSVEAETERRIAASAEAIVAHLQPVLPFAHRFADQMRRESCELALAAAKQIAGTALTHMPEEAIQHSLTEALSLLPTGLKLMLNVHPDVAERIQVAIQPRLPADTELLIRSDASAPTGSWSLSWDKGGFQHNPEELAERLQGILESYLSQPIEEQGDLFAGLA